jgi:hypothetical protein
MSFKITYEGQLVSDSLDLDEATQLAKEMNDEATKEGCEPLYVIEQQPSLEVQS